MRKKYVRKQTIEDRLERLKNGACPIHGIPMYQIGVTEPLFGAPHCYNIVECSRQDCLIQAFELFPFENAILFPEFQYLLEKDFS